MHMFFHHLRDSFLVLTLSLLLETLQQLVLLLVLNFLLLDLGLEFVDPHLFLQSDVLSLLRSVFLNLLYLFI